MGSPDFRVGGRIFATLASANQGFGNLVLTVEQQAAFVEELPEVFVPIAGGWGRLGMTHIRLAVAGEDVLAGRSARPGNCGSRKTQSQGRSAVHRQKA
jgi:hypothetical protein